jgi:hypothetical protein
MCKWFTDTIGYSLIVISEICRSFDRPLYPGDLGALRGVVNGFSEEARTRGFASLTLVRFAIVRAIMSCR